MSQAFRAELAPDLDPHLEVGHGSTHPRDRAERLPSRFGLADERLQLLESGRCSMPTLPIWMRSKSSAIIA
jgi:hypothetical protein